jgi:hypothetical protein
LLGGRVKVRDKRAKNAMMTRSFAIIGLVFSLLLSGCGDTAGPSPSESDIVGTWVVEEGAHAGAARIDFFANGAVHVTDTPYAYLGGANRAVREDNSVRYEAYAYPDESDLVSTIGVWELRQAPGLAGAEFWEVRALLAPQPDERYGMGSAIYYWLHGERPEMFLMFGDPDSATLLNFRKRAASPSGRAGRSPQESDLVGTWAANRGVHASNARIEFRADGTVRVTDAPYSFLAGRNLSGPSWQPDYSALVSTAGVWRLAQPAGAADAGTPHWEIRLELEPGAGMADSVEKSIFYARRGQDASFFMRFRDGQGATELLHFYKQAPLSESAAAHETRAD